MHGFHTARYRRRQSARRHFKNGQRAAALRAITAAKLYLYSDDDFTLAGAAAACGSNIRYVKAAATIIKSEDQALLRRVLAGRVPILFAARGAQRVACLVAAVRGASEDDLVAFGRTVGAEMLFTQVIEPALEVVQ